MAQLHKTVELGSGLHFSQDNTVQELMLTKDNMKNELRNKEELILALQESKQAAEDRTIRLETDLTKIKEEQTDLISKFEAKKEEHLREERKVKNFEISDAKQKDMIKNKDKTIKLNEEKQRTMNDENTELNSEISGLKDEKAELQQKTRELEAEHILNKSRINMLMKEKDNLQQSDVEKSNQIEELTRENRRIEKENKRGKRLNKEIEAENKRLVDAKFQAIQEKTVATNSVSALTREIEWLRKTADEDRSKLEGLENKKEKFKQSLDLIAKKIQDMEEVSKTDKTTIGTLKD